MRWGVPDALWLLLLIPALAWLLLRLLRAGGRRRERLAEAAAWRQLAPDFDGRMTRRRLGLWLASVALLLAAFARPQWGSHWEEVRRRGLDILVVLDTSRSMLATDIKPNRLQQAKWGVRDLVGKLKGDRAGLIAFAGGQFLACPLTVDYPAFLMMLNDMYCGIIPRGGTAIEQALRAAIANFEKERGQADRVIVLITDGEDHEGNPLALVEELKRQNIRVYAIGVGTTEGELVPAEGGAFFKDREGNVVKSALHEDVLARLALATGGLYVRSAPGDFGLDRIYDQGISKLKRDERESKLAQVFEERFAWLLVPAFLLLVIEAAWPRRRIRRNGDDEEGGAGK